MTNLKILYYDKEEFIITAIMFEEPHETYQNALVCTYVSGLNELYFDYFSLNSISNQIISKASSYFLSVQVSKFRRENFSSY